MRRNGAGYISDSTGKTRGEKKELHVYPVALSWRMVILSRYYAAITGDWFYDWRGIKPERYGFGYRCNDSAYIALINDRFSPSHFSVASSLQHFATTLFFSSSSHVVRLRQDIGD
jgi:hypothetical protein